MNDHTTTSPDQRAQPDSPPFTITVDFRWDAVSWEIIAAISTITDTDPTELEPLAAAIDPEALDALFGPRLDGTARDGAVDVRFSYADYRIHVQSDGTLTIHPDTGGD
jgi:hypothetical protein